MRRANGISDVAANGVSVVLIAEFSFEHEELLAAAMHVLGENTIRCITDQRRRSRDLVTDTIEHHPLDARHRRVDPSVVFWSDNDPLVKVGIQAHSLLRENSGSMLMHSIR